MSTYTVKQLARLSGVSVRTLHHYDEIGLLKPAFTGENRYRYYGREEMLRLQDILFHRELGVPLQEIALLLDATGRDRLTILREHRARLADRVERSRQLLQTIDRTIAELNGEGTMDDNQRFKGFSPEKQAEHEQWLVDKYGDAMQTAIDESKASFAKLSKEEQRFGALNPDEQQAALAEGGEAENELVGHFEAGRAPGDPTVDQALARHRAWIDRMWGRPTTPMSYAALGNLYAEHPGFRERYEARGEGFTDWLAAAMKDYAGRQNA
jgi:DNA-binding transcriptional MerR regulator